MADSTAIDFGDSAETLHAPEARKHLTPRNLLLFVLVIQGLSAAFFLGELWSEVLGLRHTPIPYEIHEIIQVAASIGLLAGMFTTAYALKKSFHRMTHLTRQVDAATGHFQDGLEELLREWELSPSERAVAIYAVKGFSNTEVAEFRGTSVATVKTQLNAVYRKSGCANRQQLMSYLVEELLSGVTAD